MQIFQVSSTTGEGLDDLYNWLSQQVHNSSNLIAV
jgi:hypothetical protein